MRARHPFGYLQCVCFKALHRFLCDLCSHVPPVKASFLTTYLMRVCELYTVQTSDPNVCTACTYAIYNHTNSQPIADTMSAHSLIDTWYLVGLT